MMKICDLLGFLDSIGEKYEFKGDDNLEITNFSSLNNYKDNSFTWIKSNKNIPENYDLSQLKLVISSEQVDVENIITTQNSKFVFFSLIEHFFGDKTEKPNIGENCFISSKVKIGENVKIGHNCVLDGDITIGDNTIIWNNVTIINRVSIGKNCEIQSGTVIGHDGFGSTVNKDGHQEMMKHFGGVVIGDYVHMGMNNVIARGNIDDTIICDYVKIADITHIGHNNYIGEDSTIICSTIYGSCYIGSNSYLAGNLVRNQTKIGEKSFLGMGAVVIKDVNAGTTVIGNPAKEYRK